MWYHLKSWICAKSLCFNNCETPCIQRIPSLFLKYIVQHTMIHFMLNIKSRSKNLPSDSELIRHKCSRKLRCSLVPSTSLRKTCLQENATSPKLVSWVSCVPPLTYTSDQGFPTFSDHVPLQYFDRWVCTSKMSNKKNLWIFSIAFRFLEL